MKGTQAVPSTHFYTEYKSMTATTETNGRVRKSLADQIDRLDGILDGLADGLNEAVVTAVKQAVTIAVREAVQAVLSEVLASPQLRESLVQSPRRPTTTSGSARMRQWGSWLRTRLLCAKSAVGTFMSRGRQQLAMAWSGVCAGSRFVHRLRKPLVIALGVGGVVGVGAYFWGPWLCTAFGGLAGFTTSLAVQAGTRLRQSLRSFPAAQG
jgi:hypothetical protein